MVLIILESGESNVKVKSVLGFRFGPVRPILVVMSLTERKETIQNLSFAERAELNRWLYGWENDEWDKQMAGDSAAGRLADMMKRAETDLANGRCREL